MHLVRHVLFAVLMLPAIALTLPVVANAQPLCALPVTAYLSDSDGTPLTGTSDIELRFYVDDDSGALPVECRALDSVPVDDGWLRVMVDTCADPVPGACGTAPLTRVIEAASDGVGLWVGIVVEDGDELEPRISVGAVPFAVRSGDSQRLGGSSADEFERSGTADARVTDHTADADAHHPADSSGIDIRPTSVTVGATVLNDGEVDLGPDPDDAITAEIARTLTGGGNADALHAHAGDSHTGGSCYTAWGQIECGEGFTVMYSGLAAAQSYWAASWPAGTSTSLVCLSSAGIATTSTSAAFWEGASLNGLANGETTITTIDGGLAPCAVCCQ